MSDLRHGQEPLSWNTRVKIALGAAKGLTYLHDLADPPVIYHDLKSSNILLDEDFNSKLSDFGLARLGPVGEDTDVSTTVMGTHGYCAPGYAQSGKLNVKSDVYSFGVLLLELITGKRPTDPCFVRRGLNVVGWVSKVHFLSMMIYNVNITICQRIGIIFGSYTFPQLNTLNEGDRLEEIIDENCGDVDVEAVEAVLDIAAMCTNANPDERPMMNRVLQMLEDEFMSPRSRDFYESHRLDII